MMNEETAKDADAVEAEYLRQERQAIQEEGNMSSADYRFDFAPRYMSVFLLPCPCCGGHADIREEKRQDPPFSYAVWFVECSKCGLRTKDFPTGGYYGLHGTPGKAAAEWNRRAES